MNKEELLGKLKTWYNRYPYCSTLDNEAYQQIKKMIQKSEGTKELVEKWGRILSPALASVRELDYQEKLVRQLLKEAGVEVDE